MFMIYLDITVVLPIYLSMNIDIVNIYTQWWYLDTYWLSLAPREIILHENSPHVC